MVTIIQKDRLAAVFCLQMQPALLLLPACGEKVGMRGLMRFCEWERLWLFTALPLTRIASQSDLSPHLRGEVKKNA